MSCLMLEPSPQRVTRGKPRCRCHLAGAHLASVGLVADIDYIRTTKYFLQYYYSTPYSMPNAPYNS